MRYVGDFRSLDQSVDPKGQQYRALIFTGYDGTSPYPYAKYGGYAVEVAGGASRWIPERYVPDAGTELTMCANPFIVRYEGDEKNKYKTHHLSRASVSFIQTSLNEDFISTLGTSVLVVLLKRKNDVVEQGNQMVNLTTGATLSKVRIYDPFMEVMDHVYYTIYYGYDWKAYEAFCYDVEWIGFSMPNTISCGFDHVKEVFTLECQDALSTLAYRNAVNTGVDVLSFKDLILPYLEALGCYDHIYITNNIHLPAAFDHDNGSNIMEYVMTQIDNYFDEDGNPQKQLDVIDVIMDYMNLTITPWRNNLIIYNPDCVQSGFMNFTDYQITRAAGNTEVFLRPGGTYERSETNVELSNQVYLNENSFCDSGTQISSGDVYDRAVIVCDEYHPQNPIPSIEDDDNLKTDIADNSQDVHFQAKSSTTSNPVWNYWECYSYRPVIEGIKCYKYGEDTRTGTSSHYDVVWSNTQTEITDEDCKMQKMGTTQYPYWPNLWLHPACIVVDNNGVEGVSSGTDVPHAESYSRQFFFNSLTRWGWSFRHHVTGQTMYYDFDDKTEYSQKLLYIKSKPLLFNGHQYLNIKGKWEFYANGNRDDGRFAMWPTNDIYGSGNAGGRGFNPAFNFIYATVKCAGKYLNVTDPNTYTWQDTEVVTKLYLANPGLSKGADYCGKQFEFASPLRNLEGLYFRIPVDEGNCKPSRIEIWFDRPMGPGGEIVSGGVDQPALCHVSTLEDFEMNITSDTYVETKGKTDPESDNTEYNTEILTGAVEEYPQIQLNLSSSDRKGLSYSETCIKRGEDYVVTDRVYNDATSSFGIPEKVILDGVIDQHTTPSIHLNVPLFRSCNITPVSRIRWGQLPGMDFLVDSMAINYEYESVEVDLMEMKESVHDDRDINVVSKTRNLYRTDDIIFNGRIARRLMSVVRNTADPASATSQTLLDTMSNHIIMQSDYESEGASRFVVDFQDGKASFSTPSTDIVAEVDDYGHLIVTVPDI